MDTPSEQRHEVSALVDAALGSAAHITRVDRMRGGLHTNLLLQVEAGGASGKYVARMMPESSAFSPQRRGLGGYDIALECAVLRDLENVATLRTPRVLSYDDGALLPRPGFLMEYIEGPAVLEAVNHNPEAVLRAYVDAIAAMQGVASSEVPSLVRSKGDGTKGRLDYVGEIKRGMASTNPPPFFVSGLALAEEAEPIDRPKRAFGNGDLNASNFIFTPDGHVAVLDWEFAGFHDPIGQIMLLHILPLEAPFLSRFPVDELLCDLAGFRKDDLWWYKLVASLSGWLYAERVALGVVRDMHERIIKEALARNGGP